VDDGQQEEVEEGGHGQTQESYGRLQQFRAEELCGRESAFTDKNKFVLWKTLLLRLLPIAVDE
jgi:hypothetical protein